MGYKISDVAVIDGTTLTNIDSIDTESIAAINTSNSSYGPPPLTAAMYDTSADVPDFADSHTFHYIRDISRLQFYDGTAFKFIGDGEADGL
jgi:hypothetical protein